VTRLLADPLAMLDAEADQLCGAGRYERSEAR
jgi:putative transposase